MIDSNPNRIEMRGEHRYSIAQSSSSREKSIFKNMFVTNSIIFSKHIPFKNFSSFYFGKDLDVSEKIDPKKISDRTTVVTLSSDHVAVLMGGFQEESNHDSVSQEEVERNSMNWNCGTESTEDAYLTIKSVLSKLLYKYKLGFLLYSLPLCVIAYKRRNANFSFSYNVLRYFPALAMYLVFTRLNLLPKINEFFEVMDIVGKSESINMSARYLAVHLKGLNVQSMRKKSDEIKKEKIFNLFNNNCSTTVIKCLRAGLTNEQVKTLPKQCSIATPMDVGDMIDFIIDHKYVELIDQQDNADDQWFDALDCL